MTQNVFKRQRNSDPSRSSLDSTKDLLGTSEAHRSQTDLHERAQVMNQLVIEENDGEHQVQLTVQQSSSSFKNYVKDYGLETLADNVRSSVDHQDLERDTSLEPPCLKVDKAPKAPNNRFKGAREAEQKAREELAQKRALIRKPTEEMKEA